MQDQPGHPRHRLTIALAAAALVGVGRPYGCINCHGPNGLGGVPNPQAADRTIPPLSGPDFREESNTDEKILAVIRSGSVIGRSPIVSMPHWGGIIPEARLRASRAARRQPPGLRSGSPR
jgi:mono/diheme cytochrome c family protein